MRPELSPVLLAACAAAFVASSSAQDEPAATPPAQKPARNVSGGVLRADQACYDVRHYALAITLDPVGKTIDGTLEMTARWLAAEPTFVLDLDPALAVASVQVDGKAATSRHEQGRLSIEADERLVVGRDFRCTVRYGGAPREAKNPPWDGGFTWAKTTDGKPWIATTCQGEGADLWWPCKDHPSDKPDGFDLRCTVPNGLVVASNGTRVGEPEVQGERTTFHWRVRSPIANYNIALNIAPYVELGETYRCVDGAEMPVQLFVLPESQLRAKRCLPQFVHHLRTFESLLGPYPFRHEKYGVAETPHLGMEHQTIIAYGNGFQDEQYDWLHNHELAHEWWGNLVTCRDWKDMWLHEGFGTYMQPLYLERAFGRKAYDDAVAKFRTMNRSPVAPRDSKTSFEIYFGGGGSNDIYYKGALVLQTLRWWLGDEKFFALLPRFLYPSDAAKQATDGSQVRFVDTEDLVALCSELAGEPAGWFFEVYVRTAGLPRLEQELRDGVLHLRWVTPNDLPFPLPVPVRLRGEMVRVPMPGGVGTLAVGEAVHEVDPDHLVLKGRPAKRR
ncbi:MAG: M1 family metallopeptidase [Planctomycetes bacterium]|nr:M1 family metallopeptidase [Planctomycetota bacterium]